MLTPRCGNLFLYPFLNVRFHPDHKAWSKLDLPRECPFCNAGVDAGFRESS